MVVVHSEGLGCDLLVVLIKKEKIKTKTKTEGKKLYSWIFLISLSLFLSSLVLGGETRGIMGRKKRNKVAKTSYKPTRKLIVLS